MKLIKNGCINTVTGPVYEKGYIIIKDGKFFEIGDMKDLDPALEFETVYDFSGKFVMPGIVDGHSHIGMWEDSLCSEGADGNEETDPVTPHLRAVDAVNPCDKAFTEALEAGVTTVVTGPGSANVLGGQFVAMKTCGICVDDMIVKAPVAVKAAFGENPKGAYGEKDRSPATRMATAAIMREAFYKALDYKRLTDEYNENPEETDKPELDFKSEALLPVLNREIPLKVHAHRLDDIFTAVRISNEFNIDITIEHATEAHLAPSKIKTLGRPVLAGPLMCDRSKPELKNLSDEAPAILEKAGIDVSIISDHPVMPCKYLTVCAAVAMRSGMSRSGALRAITVNPAKSCGIDNRVGSIEVGKDADLAIFDTHPFNITSKTIAVFVDGNCVFERGMA